MTNSKRWAGTLAMLGPAFVASVAYVDPGNFATNIEGGARYGYLLLWVIVVANVVAAFVQYLSAKTGIATGRSLAELCRTHFGATTRWGLWAQAELVAVMTDLAELVGGALALNLLFGIPLFPGAIITAIASFAVLSLQAWRGRRFEAVVTGLLLVVLLGFLYQSLGAGISGPDLASGLVPRFDDQGSVLLATGMVGATVMPHVVYLHSAMTAQQANTLPGVSARRLLSGQRGEIAVAMTLAALANLAMVVVAASLLHGRDVTSLNEAHSAFGDVAGSASALTFALALLASGFAASSVGVYAGQVIMDGFLRRRIPLVLRRASSLVPALAVLGAGVDPTRALVVSQVVLSFGIPFALVPLVMFTRRRALMGPLVNRPITTACATVAAALVISLNVVLLVLTFT